MNEKLRCQICERLNKFYPIKWYLITNKDKTFILKYVVCSDCYNVMENLIDSLPELEINES